MKLMIRGERFVESKMKRLIIEDIYIETMTRQDRIKIGGEEKKRRMIKLVGFL